MRSGINKKKYPFALLLTYKKETFTDKVKSQEAENRKLKTEIASLQGHIEDMEKKNQSGQQLTKLLQEAHKTIVESNQHLLREIDELRAKHELEAQQWQRNFTEIKKIASFVEKNM